MSRNKIMEAVILGHMLGKNNKNAVQKNHNIGHDEQFPDDWDGNSLEEFRVIPLPLPQKQIKQLVRDRQLIKSIFNPKLLLDTRRHILKQKDGLFPALFPIAAKVIGSSLLGPIIGKILK